VNSVLLFIRCSFNVVVSNLQYTQTFCGKWNTIVHWKKKKIFFPRKSNQQSRLNDLLVIYSICYRNGCSSLSLSDVHNYVIIRNLFDPIFCILLVSICWWESQIHLHRLFPHLVAYTRHGIPLFIEWMDFTRPLIGYDKRMMNWKAFRRQNKFAQTAFISNLLGREDNSPDWRFSWVSSVPPDVSRDRFLKYYTSVSFHILPQFIIHWSSYIWHCIVWATDNFAK
jgi:hypothetical protein